MGGGGGRVSRVAQRMANYGMSIFGGSLLFRLLVMEV